MIVIAVIEIEHVEQVADRRHVDGDVVVVITHARVRQVVAAAVAQLAEMSVAFDELHERGILAVDVRDMAAP